MNIGEMHIAIQQGVDKINSFQADMLLPEEIDLELNQAQDKFISLKYGKGNKYQKGFEEGQKRIDDLRTLVTESLIPATYKEQLDTSIYVDTVKLPDNYLHLVNMRSHYYMDNCSVVEFTTSNFNSVKYFTIPMDVLLGTTSSDSVSKISIVPDMSYAPINSVTLWNNPNSLTLPKDESSFITEITSGVIGKYVGAWERYGGVEYQGSFIFIPSLVTYPTLNCEASTGTVWSIYAEDANGNILYESLFKCGSITDVMRVPTKELEDLQFLKSSCKFTQQDDIYTLLKDPFNTTTYEKPLYTIRDEYLDIYTSAIFIIEEVKLTYIRKPAEISLSLQVGCELPEHTHREIVDMAVSSILETISDPRYKTHEIEVNKNE